MNPWYRFDLDGTVAEYDTWRGATHIGAPIPKMVERLKGMLAEGKECRIFTARVYPFLLIRPNDDLDLALRVPLKDESRARESQDAVIAIQKYCQEHVGQALPITCVKDYGMIYFFDDRSKQVIKNTGVLLEELIDPVTRGLLEN